MSDVLRSHYDAIPSFHGSIPESHPARICAIARLLGLPAALPDSCRVLELGCATGLNVAPLAERFPGSRFTGVDLSPVQIAAAEEMRASAGLENLDYHCADLRNWEPESGAYDYVIAHGVYSWVPDDVKDRLLALCERALAPDGIAYVSYNVLPAGAALTAMRAVLLPELEGHPDPIARAKALLPLFSQAFAQQSGSHASVLREVFAEMQAKTPEALLHDELAPVNDSVSFRTFVQHAARHGLNWFAEAQFSSLPTTHLSAPARAAFDALRSDAVTGQQFLDLLGNRRLRNSLLTRKPAPDFTKADARVVKECAIGLRMAPVDGRIELRAGVSLQLRGRHQFAMRVDKPEQIAFFAALCEAAPGRIAFSQACRRATDLLQQTGLGPAVDEDLMAQGILRLFTVDQVDLLHGGEGAWLATSPHPQPTPLTRHLAAAGHPVISRWHETVRVSDADRSALAGRTPMANPAAMTRAGLCV